MNIWLLTGEYPPDYGGGIATYSFHTAQMLSQRGHHLTVFTAVENLPGSWQIDESSEWLRVVRFGANQSPQSSALGAFARWSYDAALVLVEFCRKEGRPDVLEVQEYLGMPYYTLQRRLLMEEALANLPVLVTAHTPLYLCRQYDQLPTHRFPGYWIGEMERFSLVAADEIVYPSSYLRDEIENSKRSGFLYTAKIERRKGIEPLLSTFSSMWDAGLNEKLFLLGDDWYDELNQRWMSEVIHCKYQNYIKAQLLCWEGKQLPQVVMQKLSQARAMILPSLLENYPYAVLEAMAAGCPVIVSQSGGHAEIIEDGINGFIFAHQKTSDLEHKIKAVLELTSDEHNRIATAAQAKVKQVSDYEIIAPQKEEALEWARERMQPSKSFPFLHSLQRGYEPPENQTLAGETGLLSVVISFFNMGDYLEDALKPFESLKDVPFEILVLDDGSNDLHSLDMLKNLHERYRFRLERTHNHGLAATRNTGATLAKGEFLAFLDADDIMDPQLYRQALKVLHNYKNISFVGCWVEYFGDRQSYWPTWTPEPPYTLVHNPINTGALIYRRVDFLRYGLNDPAFEYIMEDYDSLLSLMENGCRGVVIPEPYFKYRIRSDSMFHSTNDDIKIWTYQELVRKHRALFTIYAEDIMGLTNCNGPGYMYDNPTLWYPALGYKQESGTSTTGVVSNTDYSHASTGTLFYFALRSLLIKPYEKWLGKIPWMRNLIQKVKFLLMRN
jgi:glycosyltransferase involved in cell wall biosynthesis